MHTCTRTHTHTTAHTRNYTHTYTHAYTHAHTHTRIRRRICQKRLTNLCHSIDVCTPPLMLLLPIKIKNKGEIGFCDGVASVANSEGEPLDSWMGPALWQRGWWNNACATTQPRLRRKLSWILMVSWPDRSSTVSKHRRLNGRWGAGAAQSVWVLNQHALRWTFGSAQVSSWFNSMFFVCRRTKRSFQGFGWFAMVFP